MLHYVLASDRFLHAFIASCAKTGNEASQFNGCICSKNTERKSLCHIMIIMVMNAALHLKQAHSIQMHVEPTVMFASYYLESYTFF